MDGLGPSSRADVKVECICQGWECRDWVGFDCVRECIPEDSQKLSAYVVSPPSWLLLSRLPGEEV